MAGPTKRRYALALGVLVVVALVAGLLISVPYVVADEAGTARGYAYGLSTELNGNQFVRTVDVAAEVPGPPNQGRRRIQEYQKREGIVVPVIGGDGIGDVEATACLVPGVSARLQAQIDRAKFLAAGFDPEIDTAPPERTEVFVPPGFKVDNNCVTPVDAVTDSRSGPPSPSPGSGAPAPTATTSPTPTPSPTPTATGSPTGPPPTGTPTPSPTPTRPRPVPTGPVVNCEVWTSIAAHGPTCLATLPLWNAQAWQMTDDTLLELTDNQAEAVARCERDVVEFATAATPDEGLVWGLLLPGTDPERPNQVAEVILIGGIEGLITYWETNWDPASDGTTDGSDTVYVNAIHIKTALDNIIQGHAEATADCPAKPSPGPTTPTGPTFGPSPPPGGFPRDVNLESSKRRLIYGKVFTLTGAVTPATEFDTPRRCVQNVAVTISRDVVGGAEDFVDVGTVRTDSDGHFSFNFTADRNAQWLANVAKDEPVDCAESSSEPAPVLVRPRVNVRVDQKTPPRGGTFTFTARLIPCEGSHPGTKFKLRQQVQGRMVKVAGARSDANCTAQFRRRANFDKAVFDVTWPKQDDDHQFAKSRARLIDSRGR